MERVEEEGDPSPCDNDSSYESLPKPTPTPSNTNTTNHTTDTNTPQRGRKKISLLQYIRDELKRNYMLEYNEKKLRERRKRVYTFARTPKELEKFLAFGFLLCLDVFLFIFTFLPIRLVIAAISIPIRLYRNPSCSWLDGAQRIDVMKGIVLVTVVLTVQNIDTSVIYHVVRVQSVIKLYVVYNMLEIADKLLASLGQDILDALYWTGTESRSRRREHIGLVPHLLLSMIYIFVHTLLNLAQAIVLNVAINSFNKALLIILISNQFTEIKSSVFKKFERANLFQMSCSDARERFHYCVLITVVSLRNLTEHGWQLDYALYTLTPFATVVVVSEMVVDWFKHGFITKFNNIQPQVYTTYRSYLAKRILFSKSASGFIGHTSQVSRRMGFTAIPYAVLLIKVVAQCVSLSGWPGVLFACLFYLCLCTFKLLVSIHIFGTAAQYARDETAEQKVHNTMFNTSWSLEMANGIEDMAAGSDVFSARNSLSRSKSSGHGIN